MATTKTSTLERRLTILGWLVAGSFLFIIAVPFYFSYINSTNQALVQELRVTDIELVTPYKVCPGDPVTLRFNFLGRGSGIVNQDTTWYRVSPPETIISSDLVRYILPGNINRTLYRTWFFPRTYYSQRTGQMIPVGPGIYKRYFAFSSPTRSIITEIDNVEVVVPVTCGKAPESGLMLEPYFWKEN